MNKKAYAGRAENGALRMREARTGWGQTIKSLERTSYGTGT